MAERRMFAKTIIDSDAFLDMPLSTQALYFHLSMRADDEGFINNPKKIQRMVGASEDDLKLLIAKNFIIPFESGIVVIKHWKIHNYIRGDRIKDTVYVDEKQLLEIKENGSYTILSDICQTDDRQMTDRCQHRLGKVSIDKDSIGKDKSGQQADKGTKPSELTNQFKEMVNESELSDGLKDILKEWIDYKKDIKKPYKTERGFKQLLTIVINHSHTYPDQAIIDVINYSMSNEYQGIVWDKLGKAKQKDFNQSDMSDALSEIENMYMEQVGGSDE